MQMHDTALAERPATTIRTAAIRYFFSSFLSLNYFFPLSLSLFLFPPLLSTQISCLILFTCLVGRSTTNSALQTIPVVRSDIHDLTPDTIPAPPASNKRYLPLPSSPLPLSSPLISYCSSKGEVATFAPSREMKQLGSVFDSNLFVFFANNYKLFGAPLSDLCAHNSDVCFSPSFTLFI